MCFGSYDEADPSSASIEIELLRSCRRQDRYALLPMCSLDGQHCSCTLSWMKDTSFPLFPSPGGRRPQDRRIFRGTWIDPS